ncbi:MAG: tRNA (N6-isopentenyl adenosine(37)-C2)-methylthiotransferase MiaB [Eubacteriales bacterium]
MSAGKYFIKTFGCQMNEHDSENIAGMLEELGFSETDSFSKADIAVINTCSIRENADKRFFGTLGQLKNRRLKDSAFTVCVCGCMVQQDHVVEQIKSKYPWVDLVFGTHNIHKFPELIEDVLKQKSKIIDVWEEAGDIVEGISAKRLYPFKALVNVMYGCNNFCTYCIVPYTRSRERSRRPEDIISEVCELVKDGVKEIVLLGQNVNSYGKSAFKNSYCIKSDDDTDFAGLIYKLNDIKGLERIRFMTSHPKDLSDRLIFAFRDCSKLCNSLHLPVQSGSDNVLKKMGRKYSRQDYISLVEKLRNTVPDIALTTDIIVGFPGETQEDFEDTMSLVSEIRYDSAFTFMYSIRKGTPAEKFENQVTDDVKHMRFNRLLELVNDISGEINKTYEGKIVDVLVEGRSRVSGGKGQSMAGRTQSGKLVNFEATTDELIGKIVKVKILEGKQFNLKGELLR